MDRQKGLTVERAYTSSDQETPLQYPRVALVFRPKCAALSRCKKLGIVASSSATLLVALANFADAGSGWLDERKVGGFVYHADFDLAPLVPLLQEILQLQQDVSRILELPPSNDVIDVYLFSDEANYHRYVKYFFPTAPKRRAMFVKSRHPGNVFAYKSEHVAVDLRHECTHAILHAQLSFVPLWLDEGLAEYFEVSRVERIAKNPHMKTTRRNLLWRSVPSLEKLEALDKLSEMGHRQYQEAWAWVHFMIHGPMEFRRELTAYLEDIRIEANPGQLSERLERRLPGVNKRLARHFKEKDWRDF